MRLGAHSLIVIALVIVLAVLFTKFYGETMSVEAFGPVVPRKAWSYWEESPPDLVIRIVESNKRLFEGSWDYTLITAATLPSFLDTSTFPAEYWKLEKPCHRADYIRLALLKKYGGCWLDSSIVLQPEGVQELNRMAAEIENKGAHLAVFSLGEPAEEYLENWFIMAPMGSRLIDFWFEEYDKAVRISLLEYRKQIEMEGISISKRIYNPDTPADAYLTQHACLQVVLKHRLKSMNGVIIYPSEKAMFRLQIECNWKRDCIQWRLKNDSSIKEIPFIKLRGEDRSI